MKIPSFFKPVIPAITIIVLFHYPSSAQQTNPACFSTLQWRSIGPYRGGRTVGAAGVLQQPNVFYIGVNNGGVWKTADYGRTWFPIFDNESTGSIGTVDVAPSNPDVVYVGSGEGLHRPDLSVGNGIYKSTDAGKSWMHLGLQDAQQIPKIAIDPTNPDRIFVAVLGHPYGPNEQRGIFRSLDGGKTFEKVLYKDENTGGDDVAIDPSDPNTVYATFWEERQGPWENAAWSGTKGGIYKSTDGGNTWHQLTNGLPANLVQAHIAIAASNSKIIYTAVGTTEPNEYGTGTGMGMFRSEDKGETWQKISDDGRPEARIGGGDLPEIAVDPKDPETIFSASIVFWKSVNGGKTWTGIRGAPGGDDYQNVWINPINPDILLVTGDQGAIITVNGGNTWSSWYNQPTAQLYHVNADNAFPYNVYGGQQESGSAGVASRGNDGEITFRDWHPVGAEEWGYAVPDPLNADIIYGGKLTRYNKKTGQIQDVAPATIGSEKYRFVRTAPIAFSPVDHKTMYYAGNVLFKTTNGGNAWSVISPDLTRKTYDFPASIGTYATDQMKTMKPRGVIYTIAPSCTDINTIWCGTDDGLVQITHDGGNTWNDITPAGLASWSKISIIDAGHFDAQTAYAAVDRMRCDDMHPYIYRTHDGGKSWHKITTGLPDDPINAVREDPQQKGLLFAASETAVYVSFDDGGHWQSLRLNMPASSVRDLIIKDDDIVAATHGRGFWILDDITLLRQLAHADMNADAILFKPQNAYRVRWNMNPDTPLPPDEPAGQNPPDGAVIDYWLKSNSSNTVTLEIFDASGKAVRKYASTDTAYTIPDLDIPLFWIRPQQILSAEAGAHRFMWDMHYAPLALPPTYPISAVYKNTPPDATAPWAMPGIYTAKLTVNGKAYTQTFSIKMDLRVQSGLPALQQQFSLSMQCYNGRKTCMKMMDEMNSLRDGSTKQMQHISAGKMDTLKMVDKINDDFTALFTSLQAADMQPTSQQIKAVTETESKLEMLEKEWEGVK